MRLALVTPPTLGSRFRGGGFYAERLYTALQKISGLQVESKEFSHQPTDYQKYDLIHFAYFDPFNLTLPPIRPHKTLVTVHDLIPLKFPEHFPLGKKAKLIWPIQKGLLRSVDGIITDSQASKDDIRQLVTYPAGKIHVVHLAAEPEFKPIKNKKFLLKIQKKYRLPEKFILYVGGVNWNKNLPTLLKAGQKVDADLVLVGKELTNENVDFSHPELLSFKEVLHLIKNYPKVQRLGFVQPEDLVGIYNLASVYAQPSIYEGFGLTILEAASCGTPVVCGNNSSLPEIAGDAAIYANVENPTDLSAKLGQVMKISQKDRNVLKQKSLSQAKKFSWEKTAHQTYEVYKKVLGRK